MTFAPSALRHRAPCPLAGDLVSRGCGWGCHLPRMADTLAALVTRRATKIGTGKRRPPPMSRKTVRRK